ncbi:class I SAM-dependent methyltransferase [Aurantibacter sp.]|uniref:class I SAM-dependent methyltransferase n=1 Tax=Aurantibacter sp. TaxID=2807103 RepID=UPI0035C85773
MINIKVKDFSVSGEEFTLIENTEFGYLETIPQPELENLSKYYKSEDYISHTNTKRNWFEKVYHKVRQITLNQKLNLVNSFKTESKSILDIGCGTGHFLEICKNNNWEITGIEPNESARGIANSLISNKVLDVNELKKLPKSSFDVITLWHVLEHLPNLQEQLKLINTLLKPNGLLVVAVPNYNSFDAKHYKSNWAALDVPRHLWHFNKNSIYKLSKSFGFRLKQIKPMWFDAFYVSLLSEQIKARNKNIIKAFFIGFISNLSALFTKEASSQIYILKKE